ADAESVAVPEHSWVVQPTRPGSGVSLLVILFRCIKGNKIGVPMGPWGPMFGALMNKAVTEATKRMASKWGGGSEGFDWKSLMTFLIGMWAMTSIVSSTGG